MKACYIEVGPTASMEFTDRILGGKTEGYLVFDKPLTSSEILIFKFRHMENQRHSNQNSRKF